MNTKKKWLSALVVGVTALALGGFVASQANAASAVDYIAANGCLVTPASTDHSGDIIHPAIEAQHYSLKGNSGIGQAETPVTPAVNPDIWQAAETQEPAGHYNSTSNPDGSDYTAQNTGLHYASHGSSGLRDWFYFQPFVAEWTEHHDVDVPAVYGPCPDFPVPTLFNAEPNPADCFAPGSFDDGALGGTLIGENEEGRTYTFDDGKVTLLVDISDPGLVHLYVFSTDDETVLTGLDATKWNINADQRSATRTLTLGVQLSGEEACPTDGPSPSPSPTPPTSPSPEPTPPTDDDAPPATPVEHTADFTG